MYTAGYDGQVECWDPETGEIKWTYLTESTTELSSGAYPVDEPLIADGKGYLVVDEHSPTQPLFRGAKLYCFDVITGEPIWNISGYFTPSAIAGGYLYARDSLYTGTTYCFGKGKSEVTVEAPLTAVAAGDRITIQGTVMDMSPAQPGTPAISDADMGTWMDYMHMQNATLINNPPCPTGVPVKLIVIHPDGNVEWIYTRTTDMYGNFAHAYEPPTEGIYKIIASFDGSESYWPSAAETAIAVEPGSSPAKQFGWQELTKAPISIELAIMAAVTVAVVLGVVSYWMLRKRQ
jgi:hypothetical protein